MRSTAEHFLKETATRALAKANLDIKDVDCIVVNTPTAWHAEFSANSLGVAYQHVVNTFPEVANIGPVLMPYNTFDAASRGVIKSGDIVLLYGFGGQAEASAAIFRWPDVILGPMPEKATIVNP